MSEKIEDFLWEKFIVLDNDFLSELFKNEKNTEELLKTLISAQFIIDPLTQLEFLRDIYLPQQRRLREKFLKPPIFKIEISDGEEFNLLLQNALLLSKIYAHNNQKSRSSVVDLFLAARVMYLHKDHLLLTGNKKDYNLHIFNTVATISIEQGDGGMKTYSLLAFNKEKFDQLNKDLNRLDLQE